MFLLADFLNEGMTSKSCAAINHYVYTPCQESNATTAVKHKGAIYLEFNKQILNLQQKTPVPSQLGS